MHHVKITYVSYFNDEFLGVNSVEFVYRYKKRLQQYTVNTKYQFIIYISGPTYAVNFSHCESAQCPTNRTELV